jgi:hypothetical protein
MNAECPTSSVGLRLVTVRHPKLGHLIQCRTAHQQLRRLPSEASRRHTIPKDHLNAEDCRFGQAPTMVAALALPLRAPNLTNSPQILIADLALGFPIAVLPNPSVALRRNGGNCPRVSL